MDEGSVAAASTTGIPASTGAASCHILPCKIDYSGPAAVDVYFQPTPIPPIRPGRCITVSNEDYKKLLNGSIPSTNPAKPVVDMANNPPKIQAAQFRGRGLLATYPPAPVQACVLTLNTTRKDNSMVAQVEKQVPVSAISEWHHEHQESVVVRAQRNGRGRVARGLEFCRIAAALHEPCSVPPDGH